MYLHKPCQENEASKHVKVWMQAALMLSGAWAFTGPLSKQNRELFDEYYKNLWRGNGIMNNKSSRQPTIFRTE
jgi:hypothetical protein